MSIRMRASHLGCSSASIVDYDARLVSIGLLERLSGGGLKVKNYRKYQDKNGVQYTDQNEPIVQPTDQSTGQPTEQIGQPTDHAGQPTDHAEGARVRKNSTKNKKSTPSGTQQLVALYIDLLTERLENQDEEKPVITSGRVGAIFKRLLKTQSTETIEQVLRFYIKSDKPFYMEKGWDIGMFERDYNGLKAQMTGKVKTSGKPQKWDPKRY